MLRFGKLLIQKVARKRGVLTRDNLLAKDLLVERVPDKASGDDAGLTKVILVAAVKLPPQSLEIDRFIDLLAHLVQL